MCYLVFLSVLLGAAGTAFAQPPAYRIGILNEGPTDRLRVETTQALAARGYIVGRNVVLEMRSSMGDAKLLREGAEALARLPVDVVIAPSTRPAQIMREVNAAIPIVVTSADPVGTGLVANLARPGGNTTGVMVPLIELAAKRIQLFKEMLPGITRITVLWNPSIATTDQQLGAARDAARRLGITIDAIAVRNHPELERAFAAMRASGAPALMALQDSFLLNASERLAEFALRERIPASHPYRRFVDGGGLFSYGTSPEAHLELIVDRLDRIFRGAKAGDIPVVQPERFDFVINLRTARAIGVEVPRAVLLRATEVIR